MAYVDGFLVPVPKTKLATYRSMARKAGKIFKEHGALEFRECVGDDLDVQMGRSFKDGADLKRGETVMFSWIVYKSKAQRDRVNVKVMEDPRMDGMDEKTMPFDVSRMWYGGFKVLVDL